MSRLIWLCAVALTAGQQFFVPPAVLASSLYLDIPAITGENAIPGYPDAMAIESLTVTPGAFSIIKVVDSATPQLTSAIVTAKSLGTTTALVYNTAATGPPAAWLAFDHTIGTSFQLLGGGGTAKEKVNFNSTAPVSMYLELPGITGEATTPGYTGLISIQSFSLTADDFTIVKTVDSTSLGIMSAVVQGLHFSTANLLFYDAAPTGAPDAILQFHLVLPSSYQTLGGGDIPLEQDTFAYASITRAAPEPASWLLLAAGSLMLAALRWQVISNRFLESRLV